MTPMLFLLSVISAACGSLVLVAWIQERARRFFTDRRIGLLGTGAAPSAEVRRVARLAGLGEAGTYKVHNCGRILHVDYERGELIVEREERHA